MENQNSNFIDRIQPKIHFIRGYRVMLDADLAALYGVETKALNQAVRRNLERFPPDFMFQLAEIEMENFMRSQIVTASHPKTNVRFRPFAFTEQGIAMLSSVLRSDTAIKVNIEIMRAFVKMKYSEVQTQEVWAKIDQLEKKYDANFSEVFEAIRQMMLGELPNQHHKIKPLDE